MPLSYDPEKSKRNEAERGLPFDLAGEFDWSTALIVEDARKDYEERRYQALGMTDGQLHMLAGVHAARRCGAHHQPAPDQPMRKESPCCANQIPN